MAPSFSDVAERLLTLDEDDQSSVAMRVRDLEKKMATAINLSVKSMPISEYCAGIMLDLTFENVASFLDGGEVAFLSSEDSEHADIAGVHLDSLMDQEAILGAAQENKRLIPSLQCEEFATHHLRQVLDDAEQGQKDAFAAITEFEAGNLIERAAHILANAMIEEQATPAFKIGDTCLVYRFEDDDYHSAHIKDILEDGQLCVRLNEFDLEMTVAPAQIAHTKSIDGSADDDDGTAGEGACELCGSDVRRLTRHHLIPKLVHNSYRRKGLSRAELNVTTDICRPCHNTVHRAEPHAVLASSYNTVEKLKEHPEIAKWIEFAATKRSTGRWDHAMMVSHQRLAQTKRIMKYEK